MSDKMSRSFYSPGSPAFQYATAGGDSGSGGGSGGSGMECLRSPPGPFHYLISEQAKSLVALQELQNEVGALLEFRDLVIETFPNLRSKMGTPSGVAIAARRDWEPGVRVRRKLAATGGEASRSGKPQPSVQDSGFSTETSASCSKDAHSSTSGTPAHGGSAATPAPIEDELWRLLDVIQRKGSRLRDEVEILRGDLVRSDPLDDFVESLERVEEREARWLRRERDALLGRAADLEAETRSERARAAAVEAELDVLHATNEQLENRLRAVVVAPASPAPAAAAATPPLGKLDRVLATPSRPPRVRTPDSKKFSAILLESNPAELQRQLLTSTVHSQVLLNKLNRLSNLRSTLIDRLERAKEENEDLKFQLEEKGIELEGTKARVRVLESQCVGGSGGSGSRGTVESRHSSMRAMRPLIMPDDAPAPSAPPAHEQRITDTPRRSRPSRIPLLGAGVKQAAPRRHDASPARPASATSGSLYGSRSASSVASNHARSKRDSFTGKLRNNDSLSRVRDSPVNNSSYASTGGGGGVGAGPRKLPVRRASSVAGPRDEIGSGASKVRQTSPRAATRAPARRCDINPLQRRPPELICDYLRRTERLAHLPHLLNLPDLQHITNLPLPELHLGYERPQNLAIELSKSILLNNVHFQVETADLESIEEHIIDGNLTGYSYSDDSLWNGKPQQYFETVNESTAEPPSNAETWDCDSLLA